MKLNCWKLTRGGLLAGLAVLLMAPGALQAQTAGVARIPTQAPTGGVEPVLFHNCPNCQGTGLFRGWGCNTCGRCPHGLAHGWAFARPPATVPLSRAPNVYSVYWSPELRGERMPLSPTLQFPMVYQPTDTTQLGFYYTNTPRWHYRPQMLPPAPLPYWPLGQAYAYPVAGAVVVQGPVQPVPANAPPAALEPAPKGAVPPPPVVD